MTENTEEFLQKISMYQIIASQLNGCFPLSILQTANSKNGRLVSRLTFSVLSIPFIYTLLQCLIFPLILRQVSNFNSFIVTSVTKGIVSDFACPNYEVHMQSPYSQGLWFVSVKSSSQTVEKELLSSGNFLYGSI